MKKEILKKKIHPLITYPVLIIFSFSIVFTASFFYFQSKSFAQTLFQPFEGEITDVDYYSCVCGLSTLITIRPTLESSQDQPQQFLFFYAPQILETLGVDFEWFPIPRVYRNYLIWYAGPQQLLGNYSAFSLPCVAYAGYACYVSGYYPAILNVGTSWE